MHRLKKRKMQDDNLFLHVSGEDYHQIPIERFDKADANYRGLWIQLENFVNPNGEKPEYPPFYCMVSRTFESILPFIVWLVERFRVSSLLLYG